MFLALEKTLILWYVDCQLCSQCRCNDSCYHLHSKAFISCLELNYPTDNHLRIVGDAGPCLSSELYLWVHFCSSLVDCKLATVTGERSVVHVRQKCSHNLVYILMFVVAGTWIITGHGAATKGIIVCSYLAVCSFASTVGPVSWTYPAEIVCR